MDILVSAPEGQHAPGEVQLTLLDDAQQPVEAEVVTADLVPKAVAEREVDSPRWVWPATEQVYPALLAAGVRVRRCLDLRLAHAVLAGAAAIRSELPDVDGWWSSPGAAADELVPSLLDEVREGLPFEVARAEHAAQQHALDDSLVPGRLRLLLSAESAGALLAAEMRVDGLPWDRSTHEALLAEMLGPRPLPGGRPARLEALLGEIRAALGAPTLNPDSQADLLKALRSAGLDVESTRSWELQRLKHPVAEPLLVYKKLARLLSANGWHWLDTWVRDGRFHPDYVVAGVVTGRWATRGGGALQLPKQVRSAVRADPGCVLVVADAAQLEPRVLAAMTGDAAMAAAGQGDLYQGLVDAGVMATRADAKVGMLGALYGATSGDGGRLMPRLLQAYPQATGLVEEAARTGERGGRVSTWLGRTSPEPGAGWRERQQTGYLPEATPAQERAARGSARDWGRFTRNFVVQGTAAEWALCWLAGLRQSLTPLDGTGADRLTGPRIVYFLHDEVIVHTPAALADEVADLVRAAAVRAGRLLFADSPVTFPLDVSVVTDYGQAD